MGLDDHEGKAAASRPDGSGTAPVLDPAALQRLAELDPSGDGRLIERVLNAFRTSAERLSAQFEAARASGDHAALRLVTHTLKSSSASIGAMHLARLSAQIEAAIRAGAIDDLGAPLAAFDGAIAEALAAVAAQLQGRA